MRKFRVNADLFTVLRDILSGDPEDFNSDRDSLRGRRFDTTHRNMIWTGRMPSDEAVKLNDSMVSYVVYSYATPIAYRRVKDWNADGTANYEWVVPDVRYSVTTSKHQSKVRAAASILNRGDVSEW